MLAGWFFSIEADGNVPKKRKAHKKELDSFG